MFKKVSGSCALAELKSKICIVNDEGCRIVGNVIGHDGSGFVVSAPDFSSEVNSNGSAHFAEIEVPAFDVDAYKRDFMASVLSKRVAKNGYSDDELENVLNDALHGFNELLRVL